MKQIILLIVALFSIAAFTQTPNWTSVKETNINVNGAYSVDIFTNGVGNHIIVQESNALKYYKLDVNGTAGTPVTLESTSVVSPSISGDATRIYVVYVKSNVITAKYSTNGGASWSYISNLNYNASSMESVFSNNKLHVTYQVSNVIYYSYYNTLNSTWSSQFTVSTNENGTGPRITAWYNANNDKVYFYYEKASTDKGKWREYNVTTGSWGTLWEGYSLSNVQYSGPAGFRVDDSKIYLYYWYYGPDPFGDYHYYFNWVVRYKNNTWANNGTPDMSLMQRNYSTTTVNETNHTVFYYTWLAGESQWEVGIWRSNDVYGYPTDLVYEYLDYYFPNYLNLSSSSNDVYVIWQDGIGGNNLRLIYDDQNPLAPQGLTAGSYQQGNNTYPRLTWQLNNEPDVYIKQNAFEIWRRIKLWENPWSSWSVVGYKNGNVTEFIDYEIIGAFQAEVYTAEYKIRAKDVNNHYSSYSNVVTVEFRELAKITSGKNNFDYNLGQNYPNPFNPATTIDYSIKSTGMVTLKVYDMLGTEVASLVNEMKEAGSYSVVFNAANLPSGMYVYRLTADKFVETKKLILLK